MPMFTIETTYRLPIYRHRTYCAETPEAACRIAIEDEDWDEGKQDYECAGETYVTGIWSGAKAPYRGDAITVPPHFDETIQRKADHFELLLGLLKIVVADARASRPTEPKWLAKANWAIALAEAIFEGARGPLSEEDAPPLPHVIAVIDETRVREMLPGIVHDHHAEFGELRADDVREEDIHSACRQVAASTDLSREVWNATFQAGLAALRRHLRTAQAPTDAGGE
ncbi:MAG: hypothetical protein AB7F74_15460 [Parvibaculaceae bacterium]